MHFISETHLADGVVEPDPATLRDLLAQVERLGRLVDDVLDLSRLEAGAAELRVEQVLLAPLVARAVADAGDDGRVAVVVAPADLSVRGDADRLHQVVVNLVANALRHGPADAPVHVRAEPAREDAGPSVSPPATRPSGARGRRHQRFTAGSPPVRRVPAGADRTPSVSTRHRRRALTRRPPRPCAGACPRASTACAG